MVVFYSKRWAKPFGQFKPQEDNLCDNLGGTPWQREGRGWRVEGGLGTPFALLRTCHPTVTIERGKNYFFSATIFGSPK